MRKISSLAFPSLWKSSSTPFRIRLCETLILIWQRIYCVFRGRSIRTFKRFSNIILWSGRTLEDVRDYLLEQAGRGRLGRAMNLAGDGDNILKCKEMVDNSFKDFQVCSPGLLSITVFNKFIDVYVHLAPIGYGGLA